MTKKKTVEFEEGWADELLADGTMTQEEIDSLVKMITEFVEDGTIFEDATPVADLPEEEQEEILKSLQNKNTRH
jgi:hypothetical protein